VLTYPVELVTSSWFLILTFTQVLHPGIKQQHKLGNISAVLYFIIS